MLVEDLIKELQKLPQKSNIGMVDVRDSRVSPFISIVTKEVSVKDLYGDDISIESIEKSRITNKEKICDFYIL